MGLLSRIATVLADKYEGETEAQTEFNAGIKAMMARGGKPDTIREEQAAYHAQLLAEVNGVTVDVASPEYAAWYHEHYGR